MQLRSVPQTEEEAEKDGKMEIKSFYKIFKREELFKGANIMLAATGVTDGNLLKGVRYIGAGAYTHSIVMRSESGTIWFVSTEHHFAKEPDYH